MKRKIVTKTYGHKDNPTITILEGRVGVKDFNKAHKNEGWDGDISKSDIQYGFFKIGKNSIKRSNIEDLKSTLCTYFEW